MLGREACRARRRATLASARGVPVCVTPRRARLIVVLALFVVLLTVSPAEAAGASPAAARTGVAARQGIHKIQHVVVIMQENRSFDHYFGTFPGADGFPRTASGEFAVCVPNPATGGCEKPFHDTRDLNAGGPHGQGDAIADVDGGKMDG